MYTHCTEGDLDGGNFLSFFQFSVVAYVNSANGCQGILTQVMIMIIIVFIFNYIVFLILIIVVNLWNIYMQTRLTLGGESFS